MGQADSPNANTVRGVWDRRTNGSRRACETVSLDARSLGIGAPGELAKAVALSIARSRTARSRGDGPWTHPG